MGSSNPHGQGTEASWPISVSGHVTRSTLPQTETSSLGQPSRFAKEGDYRYLCMCAASETHMGYPGTHAHMNWDYYGMQNTRVKHKNNVIINFQVPGAPY